MNVTFWGTRGSVASPGPETARYGGNTSSLSVVGQDGTWIALDAGTGIRRMGQTIPPDVCRVDILLTHLHMDHIQGLGFFAPLYNPRCEVHIWGPACAHATLKERLERYLSPPLFPVRLRELPCRLLIHECNAGEIALGGITVTVDRVCHPDPTVGYRLDEGGHTVTYLPDHEPALGSSAFTARPEWLSGFALAEAVDLLIHDAQYTDEEYATRIGWGHSTVAQAIEFARAAGARKLVAFHHDPSRTDAQLESVLDAAIELADPTFAIIAAHEGLSIDVPAT